MAPYSGDPEHLSTGHRQLRQHPRCEVVADRISVCNSRVWTSAGMTSGRDLAQRASGGLEVGCCFFGVSFAGTKHLP